MKALTFVSRRVRAPTYHLLGSALVATLAAAIVFGKWYPPPFHTLAAGISLFSILIGVDVIMGPVLTAIAADPHKPVKTFRRDLAVILMLQAAALGFGLYTLAQARPVILSFEVDRLRVLTANEIDPTLLPEAPLGLRDLSWSGPRLIAAAKPKDRAEFQRSLDLALGGLDISYFPKSWREYSSATKEVWSAAIPVSALLNRYPSQTKGLAALAARANQPVSSLGYLPVLSRYGAGTAIVALPDSRVIGYLPVDGFL